MVAELSEQWEQELMAQGSGSLDKFIYKHSLHLHLQTVSQNLAGWEAKPLFPQQWGCGPSLLGPGLEVLATRAGGHQPGRALFPRNGLQWSVNGQILA